MYNLGLVRNVASLRDVLLQSIAFVPAAQSVWNFQYSTYVAWLILKYTSTKNES